MLVLVYSKLIQLYIYMLILFHILFHFGLLQDTEYSSLCYTVQPVFYTCYMWYCVSDNPKLIIYPSPSPLPFGSYKFVFSVLSLFLSHKQVHFCQILDSTHKCYHVVFVFLCLTYFISYDNL